MTAATYCIDASALLDLRLFRREIFVGVWERMETLVEEGRLIAPFQVRTELVGKGGDAIEEWVKQQPEMFIEIDESQGAFIRGMYERFPHVASQATNRLNVLRADPFVIAVAATQNCCVVTSEGKKEWGIPDLCKRYDIISHDLYGMMINEGWTFR